MDNKKGESSALNKIGLVYKDKGELDNALKYQKKSLKINREIEDKQNEGNVLSDIGQIYRQKGYLDDAIDYYQKALKIRFDG